MIVWMVQDTEDWCSDCGANVEVGGVYADTPDGLLLALGAVEDHFMRYQRSMKSDPVVEIEPNTRDALGGWDVTARWDRACSPSPRIPSGRYSYTQTYEIRSSEVQGS